MADDDTMLDDTTVAARIRAGDASAFRALMHAHFEPAARVAFRLLHSADAAHDVVQQIFGHLWQHRTTFHPTRSIRSYLLKAAHNNALKELRHQRVQDRHAHATRQAVAAVDNRVSTPSDAAAIDDRTTVATILATLSDRHRQALELRYLEQLSYVEVGEILGISAGAAEQLVIRALTTLRQAYSQE